MSDKVVHWLGISNIILSSVALAWAIGLTVLYEKGAIVSHNVRIGFGVVFLLSIIFGIYIIINVYGRYVTACVKTEDKKAAAKQSFTGVLIASMALTGLLIAYVGYFLMYKVTAVAETHVRAELSGDNASEDDDE
mgnify:CR=1 FL=1